LLFLLAGFINNTEKNKKSDSQYTIDNFEFCLGNIIQSSFQFVIDSFRFILSGIMTLFEDIFYYFTRNYSLVFIYN